VVPGSATGPTYGVRRSWFSGRTTVVEATGTTPSPETLVDGSLKTFTSVPSKLAANNLGEDVVNCSKA
jgi:hypothetical protein